MNGRHVSYSELDRAAGVLVGSTAGDALGAGYELGLIGPRDPDMIGGGPFGWEPGEWTDDTQMAICIAEEAASGQLDPVAVGSCFPGLARSGPGDIGSQSGGVLLGPGATRRPSRSPGGRCFPAGPRTGQPISGGVLRRRRRTVSVADDKYLGEDRRQVTDGPVHMDLLGQAI